jgi:hypothetical protein
MASMKKPVKKSASTSNRVKPVSSAAKVRMADEKMTKAANAKAPRYPRGMQGYGMDTSRGGVVVFKTGRGTVTNVISSGLGKKTANSLVKSAVKSKSAGVRGRMTKRETDFGDFGSYSKETSSMESREYKSKSSPKKKSRSR